MSYRPLVFSEKPVEVLQVRAPRRSYWRAVVLAEFDGSRFSRSLQAIADTRAGGSVRVQVPPTGRPLRAQVQVTATVSSFLVAPGRPVRYVLPAGAGPVDLAEDGTAELRIAPSAGFGYAADGVDPDPGAADLRPLPPAYPGDVAGELRFAGEAIPPFGREGRDAAVAALFRLRRADPVWRAWQAAYAQARTATRGAATPYQAVVALEAWLRTTRAYDEHAGLPGTPDALARWVVSGDAGHCQMFAASLAALARLSGVPARVAEGFAPGDRRDGVFHVTDRDAHAWVEAWFPGYGWLPFDATPGRSLPERASSSSASFDGLAAQARPKAGGPTGTLPRLQLPLGRLRATASGGDSGRSWWDARAALILAVLGGVPVGLLLAKRSLLRRALPPDPASAARSRVGSFAADQGLELSPALTPREFGARARVAIRRHPPAVSPPRSSAPPTPRPERGRRPASRPRPTGSWMRCAARSDAPRRLRGAFSLRGLSAARDRAR